VRPKGTPFGLSCYPKPYSSISASGQNRTEANHPRRRNATTTTIFFHASTPCSSNPNFHHLFPSPWQPPPLSEATHRTTVSSSSLQCTTVRKPAANKNTDPQPTANRNTDPQPARNANTHPDADHHHHATMNDTPDAESSATANEGCATANEGSEPPLQQRNATTTFEQIGAAANLRH